ncbi:hypothetical protein FRC02_004503, partial [Tulasnella sp. 418]
LRFSIQFDNGFTATHVLHPATYLNKVLVGSAEGNLELWNIQTRTRIHQFNSSSICDSSSASAAITALVQSPAIDVVGIALSSGEVSIYDIKTDERLLRVHMEGGGVTSISFRADGEPVFASASSSGHIALWDLNKGGRLLHVVRGAHDGSIASVQWIPGQPILISSGADNSIKQWLFDSPTAAPRLLKYRSGHHAPPHLIRYYGDDGKQILTAARDRALRCTSVVRDSRSFELSQGPLAKKATSLAIPITNLKFPPVTSISFSNTRSKDWDDVLTTHADESFGRTWFVQDKKCGKWTLHLTEPPAEKGKKRVASNGVGVAKVSAVTSCGNFGLVGSSTGIIQMWNMQSGLLRKTFTLGPPPADNLRRSHSLKVRPVTGLVTDALNRLVIASTLDGTLSFFDFHSTKLEHTVTLPSGVVSILLQRDNGLLATICDDLKIRIVDIETRRVVREFSGFKGRILDMAFSPDSRWLIASSLDSIIRTFDIPTGRLIDAFRTPSVASSITFSPTGDFLATAHIDSVGVFLWANRAQYSDVSLKSINEDDVLEQSMPSVQGMAEDGIDALAALTLNDPEDVYATPAQLDEELLTLTLLPRSKWQTLLNIDIIQQRNKPKEPPKAPDQAPFFLPSLPGVEQRFDLSNKPEESTQESKKLDTPKKTVQSDFVVKLFDENEEGHYEDFFGYIKHLSPAALDLEIRSLSSTQEIRTFTVALTQRLQSHRDFEAVQALMKVFLRIHGETFVTNEELRGPLEKLNVVQRRESSRLLDLIASSLGTLSFVRDTV